VGSHVALITFFIPSFLLFVLSIAFITQSLCRQSVVINHRQLQGDTKLQLLSTTSTQVSSPTDVNSRQLAVLTVMMLLGLLSWASAAMATVVERETVAETVASSFYLVCTSALSILLFAAYPPTSSASCSRRLFTCLERSTVANNHCPLTKQVVYSIAASATPACHMSTSPTVDVDTQEVPVRMRDCSGSSCSVSQSADCEVCRFCRSPTDGSSEGRSFSRCSTRLKDFDDFSWYSDDHSLKGGWWNSEVDIDGCSIHRAPCPSPASACSSRITNEQPYSPQHHHHHHHQQQQQTSVLSSNKRRWSVVGASPDSARTPADHRVAGETR